MQKIILCCGIPASGKSTWAREEVKKNPNIVRINMDDLRASLFNSVYSEENEKIIKKLRKSIIVDAIKSGRDIIDDNTNLNYRTFDDICKIANEVNIPCMVTEKPFYIELDEAIARNAKREGFACIPEDAIRKMWKASGGTQHKFYKPRMEMCGVYTPVESNISSEDNILDMSKTWAVLCDLDGTISLFNPIRKNGSIEIRHNGAPARNPYDASKADNDMVNEPVAEVLEKLSAAGYQIIFCSGRTDDYRPQTEAFLKKHVGFPYKLIMRKTGDNRPDEIIKKEIYNNEIKSKYNVFCVFDDRLKVCKMWHELGLMLFRVGDPCSDF